MRVLFAGLALLLAAAPAAAQPAPGLEKPVELEIGGGPSVPVGDARDAFHNGWHARGFLRLRLPALPMVVRLGVTFQHFGWDAAHVGASGSQRLFAGVGSLEYDLLSVGPVRPCILAGAGVYQVQASSDVGASTSVTRFGLDAGAGATLKLMGLSLFAEAHVANVFDAGNGPGSHSLQMVPLTVGVLF
ncbi:MAG TPA: hypothetical protein VMS93_00905 [Candidatus Saccharimonadales bacterium]|nr:hypothetical protein [Candidatus Saccharimonadales bacterium]